MEMLEGATLPVAGFEQFNTNAIHAEDVLLRMLLRRGLSLVPLGSGASGDREPVPDGAGDRDIERDPDRYVVGKRQTQ